MTKRLIVIAASLSLVLGAAAGSFLLSGVFTSQALQNPTLSLDMSPGDNTYSDPGLGGTNTINVGPITNCLTTNAPGNNLLHNHTIHVVVQNIVDMIGWQARLNYVGDQWRPNTVQFTPYSDSGTVQSISFVNLPIDSTTFVHRDLTSASQIPAQAPGPQTAAFGSAYLGTQSFEVSADTPPKSPSDGGAYSAPSGGVLATVQTQVLAGNSGKPSLFLNLDDGSPNTPGTGIS